MKSDRVCLYHVQLEEVSEDVLAGFWTILSDQEQDRCRAAVVDTVRRERTMARVLTRLALSSQVERSPEDWRFRETELGRPELDDDFRVGTGSAGALHFNAAHSGGVVVVAVSQGRRIGVDVEDVGRPLSNLTELLTFLAPAERARITESAPDFRAGMFFRFWTLKEAYAKADGRGLSLGFSDFGVEPGPPPVLTGNEKSRWQLRQWELPPAHVAALAVEAGEDELVDVSLRSGQGLFCP